MPLLYRILMRLALVALVALVAGLGLSYLIMGKDTFETLGTFIGMTAMGAIPAAAIAAIAWVVKPPGAVIGLQRFIRRAAMFTTLAPPLRRPSR